MNEKIKVLLLIAEYILLLFFSLLINKDTYICSIYVTLINNKLYARYKYNIKIHYIWLLSLSQSYVWFF
jgi:hypothetical protein